VGGGGLCREGGEGYADCFMQGPVGFLAGLRAIGGGMADGIAFGA